MPSNDELRRSLLEPRDRLLRLREDDLSDEDGDHWVWVFAARAARGIKQCEDAGLPVVAEIRQRDAKLNAEHRALAMRKQNGEELSEEEEIFLSGCSPDKEPWEWPSEEDEKYEPGVAVDAALNPWASCFLDICDIYGANGDRTFGGYRVASYATRQIRPEDWRQRAEDFATTCKSIVDRFLPDEITTDRRCAAELAEILRLPEASPAPGAIGGMTGDEQKEVIKDILHFSDSVRACLERLSDLFLWTDSADPSAVGEMEAQEFRDNYKSWGSDIAEAWMTHDATRGALMIAAKGFTLLEWPHASGHHATLWLCMMLAAELKESVWESGESDDPFDIPSATAGAIFDAVSYVGHLMDVPRVFEECSLAIDREKRIIGTAVQLEDPLVLQRFMQGHRVLDGSIGEGITKERKAKRKRSEAGKKGAKTKAQRKEQQQMALTDQLAKARAAGVHDVAWVARDVENRLKEEDPDKKIPQWKVAEEMTRLYGDRFGMTFRQQNISDYKRQRDKYREAGYPEPMVVELPAEPQFLDPKKIDLGPRQDHRTPRQRDKYESIESGDDSGWDQETYDTSVSEAASRDRKN